MIKLITGGKGTGKTKRLIQMANEAVKTTDGHIVFIDDDSRHIYDLHYDIRFVDTTEFPLSNYREFIGFVYGILSQNSDITEIFVDGIHNVITNIDDEGLLKLKKKIDRLCADRKLDFFISINSETEDLPEELKEFVV